MPDGVKYELISSSEELEAFAPRWSALWRSDPAATPFQSPEWLVPWWRWFGGPDLRTVAIFRKEKLVGLVPLYVYHEPRTGERQLLLLGAGTSDYLDGAFDPGCTPEEIAQAVDLACAKDGWDTLYAPQLRAGSKLFQALEHGSGFRQFAAEACSRMAAVPMAELPQKIRRNAMYYRNRARRLGELDLAYADGSICIAMFDALRRLHGERWTSRGENGVLADELVLAWHREAIPQLERAGLLRLCWLRLNGETMGVLYSLIDPPGRPERTQYFYLPAFSIEHAALRPGTLLTALAIERAADEGVRVIDMLRGDEEYKRLWHTERAATFGVLCRNGADVRAEIAA